MMKKLLTTFVLVLVLPAMMLSAAWVPTYSISLAPSTSLLQGNSLVAGASGYTSFYANPAGLTVKDETVHYSLDTWFNSDIQTLSFLANPGAQVRRLASKLSSTVGSMSTASSIAFWSSSPELISQLYTLDANFPVASGATIDNYAVNQIKQYFAGKFLASDYGNARWGQAILAFMNQSDFFGSVVDNPRSWLGGGLDVGMAMGTSRVNDGFGWAVSFAVNFSSGSSLLSSYGGALDVSLAFPVGYAWQTSEVFSFGFAIRPEVMVRTAISNANFLNARFENDFVTLFSSDMEFGAGFALDFGMNFKINDQFTMGVALRNIPTLQHYVYTPLTELAGIANGTFPTFYNDSNVYFTPPDIALGCQYSFNGWGGHDYVLNVEASDVVSQFIWNNYYPQRPFYVDNILKVELDIVFSDSVRMLFGYKDQFASVGVTGITDAGTYSFSVATRVFRFEAGGSLSFNFRMAF